MGIGKLARAGRSVASGVRGLGNAAVAATERGIGRALFKNVPRNLGNFGTGVKMRKGFNIALPILAIAGGVAFGAISSDYQRGKNKPYSEYGYIPGMSYDAVANGSYRTMDRSLGATGELVFGLHKGR